MNCVLEPYIRLNSIEQVLQRDVRRRRRRRRYNLQQGWRRLQGWRLQEREPEVPGETLSFVNGDLMPERGPRHLSRSSA